LSPWHLHCSCHGRAVAAASRAHEVSGEVHAHSRCRAGHREQECASPLCVARMWTKSTTVVVFDRSRYIYVYLIYAGTKDARDRRSDQGRQASGGQIRRYTNPRNIYMIDEMRRLPLCGLILVRVRGHAVEVLLMLPAASPLTGWLAGWRWLYMACRDARIG
jgi:hypothetical protein